jgi:hypothetical protein
LVRIIDPVVERAPIRARTAELPAGALTLGFEPGDLIVEKVAAVWLWRDRCRLTARSILPFGRWLHLLHAQLLDDQPPDPQFADSAAAQLCSAERELADGELTDRHGAHRQGSERHRSQG